MGMEKIVLDTNSLIQCISSRSPYRKIWDSFFDGTNLLCVTTSILDHSTQTVPPVSLK